MKTKTDDRVQALMMLEVMARKQHWKEMGRRTLDIDPVELAKATNLYLNENRARLREEARIILNQV